MPLATSAQYAEMLDAAKAGGYAFPAVNVSSSTTLNAAILGFVAAGSDGIVQVSRGGGEFAAGPAMDRALGARALADYAAAVAEQVPILVVPHGDHCPPEDLDNFLRPLLAESRARHLRGGQPLLLSQMFDGSSLPLEENLAIAASLLAECAAADVILEVEIGAVGGEEDGIRDDESNGRLYSTPEEALAVVDALGSGERGRYLLSATFGNVHGHYQPGKVALRPSILGEIQRTVIAHHGERAAFDLVFHGGSGSTPEQIAEAVSHGVVKMNLDTDAQYAYTRTVADHMFLNYAGVVRADCSIGDKHAYDPRTWGRSAEQMMAARVVMACHHLGSAGRSLTDRAPQPRRA
jgi:fructose-bisphosphate aldolase, class II